MHPLARQHNESGDASAKETKGKILNGGWLYDLEVWFIDTFFLRGKARELLRRTIDLAGVKPGGTVLDVGCGTGTLAIEVQRRVGPTGHVSGVDPGTQQIARARAKAARRPSEEGPVDFRVGVVEDLPYPDQTFDIVFSTIMMHELPDDLKRQGLSEISRVLKPGGCLVIADFKRPEEHQGQSGRHCAAPSDIEDLPDLVRKAGFSRVETEEMPVPRIPLHADLGGGVVFVRARRE